MTAAEIMEKLSKDPEYQKRRAEQEQRFREREAFLTEEEKDLVSDLHNVGRVVSSVWDLVNTGEPYPEAVPVLLKHLRLPYSERTREGIARALAVREAGYAWDILWEEFEKIPGGTNDGPKWGLACALSTIAPTTNRFDEAYRILRDERYGEDRLAFLDVFAFSKDPERRAILKEFADDPQLGDQTRWYLKHPGRRRH